MGVLPKGCSPTQPHATVGGRLGAILVGVKTFQSGRAQHINASLFADPAFADVQQCVDGSFLWACIAADLKNCIWTK